MKNLYSLTTEINTVHDNFCFQVMKNYLELMQYMFLKNFNGYTLAASDLRDDVVAHKKNEIKLSLHFNDENDKKIITKSESLYLNKYQSINNVKHLVDNETFEKLTEFYNNVLDNSNPILTELIKNHLKSLTPSAIKLDRDNIKNIQECAQKIFGEKYFIFYEKEMLENNSCDNYTSKNKNKL